jgi:hypothetical protein
MRGGSEAHGEDPAVEDPYGWDLGIVHHVPVLKRRMPPRAVEGIPASSRRGRSTGTVVGGGS